MGGEPRLVSGGDDFLEQSSILGDSRQRRVLSTLLECSRPITERDLAVQLAARESGREPSEVPEEDRRAVRIDLHHRCLPKLEATGVIERHPEGIVVEPLSLEGEDLTLPDLQDPDHPSWEAVSALLARPRRLDLVAIIADQRRHLTLEAVATELAECGHASWVTEGRGDESALLGTLHHVDLPTLAEVGLIEYDPDEKTIARTRALMTLVNRTDLGDGVAEETDTS